jgi:uncharacterized membrane protein YozB (DUF420 family)
LITNINLVLQIIILAVLVTGYIVIRLKKIGRHAYIMLSAVIVHLASILLAMAPAAVVVFTQPNLRTFVPIVGAHIAIGTVAIGLGIYIIRVWRLDSSGARCFRMKNLMMVLLPLWITEIILGIGLYYQLNP